MTYFIDGNQMYATHILMMFAIVIGLYPIRVKQQIRQMNPLNFEQRIYQSLKRKGLSP